MISSGSTGLSKSLLMSSFTALFLSLPAGLVHAQTPGTLQPEPGQPDLTLPGTTPGDTNNQDLRPLSQDGSFLSIPGGKRLMEEASAAVSRQDYDTAVKKLQEARQVFNQLSNFYQELAASFTGIDNRIADNQRRNALESAQMRDQATYQLALVHRAQNQPELAVPLLVQIIRSQQPTRDLGKNAYQQLYELGFVDSPFPSPRPSTP